MTRTAALGAVVLYRYVNIGPLGPLPDMYEPFWCPAKVATMIAEAVAVAAAASGTGLPKTNRSPRAAHRSPGRTTSAAG